MDSARVIRPTLIVTDLLRRGDGEGDPIRVVHQLWTEDGQLVAEWDPMDKSIRPGLAALLGVSR